MLQLARERAMADGATITFHHGDIRQLGMFQKRPFWLYSLVARVAQNDPGVYG
jgi:hypothetical protein